METHPPPPTAPAEPAAAAASDVSSASGVERLRRYIYWSLIGTLVALVLLFTVTGPVPVGIGPWGAVIAINLLIFSVAVTRLTSHHLPSASGRAGLSRGMWSAATLAGSASAIVIAVAWARTDEPFMWSLAPAVLASLLLPSIPKRTRGVASTVMIAIAMAISAVIASGGEDLAARGLVLGTGLLTAFVLSATVASVWMWNIVVELDVARRTQAHLAVANERLRFAADLHDIQGHHLQVIALKSELAARLVRTDPDTALHEIESTHELALDALRDTRAVVQGYRRTSLATEIANATTVLGSAGIDARFEVDPSIGGDQLPEASRHLLGLVVREAITNVLRHSAAQRAEVQLSAGDPVRLRITNDGVSQDPEPSARGLQTLADRLADAGGSLSWRRHADGFEVVAELPTQVSGDTGDAAGANGPTPDAEPEDAPRAGTAPTATDTSEERG